MIECRDGSLGRGRFLWIGMAIVWLALTVCPAHARLNLYDYFSRWNPSRPTRPATDYIILHTTEGSDAGALAKLRANGEANYLVDTKGNIFKIIDRRKIALHCGRSMWNGHTDIDNCSIGIEVVGFHDKDITPAQYATLKDLLSGLKAMYRIPDDRVLTHSMVAYAAPNRWFSRSHRGRKRCGMQFAKRSVRLKLGLQSQPLYDPDVREKRLIVGDPYLASVLYGNPREQEIAAKQMNDLATCSGLAKSRTTWDVAGSKFNSTEGVNAVPDVAGKRGSEIVKWAQWSGGTKMALRESQGDNEPERVKEIGVDGTSAREIAGDEYNRETTLYFLLDGRVKRGTELTEFELLSLPAKTRMLVGYVCAGYVTDSKTAVDVCGKRWNVSSTFYRFPNGSIRAGNLLSDGAIPKNVIVFCRN